MMVTALDEEKLKRQAALAALTTTSTAAAPTPAPVTKGFSGISTPNAAGQTGGFAAAMARTDPRLGSTNAAEVLGGITSQDSALMQHARTKGRQVANRRGLLNSTLAGEAQQVATLDAALPLAQQVAQTNAAKEAQAGEQAWRSGEADLERDLKVSLANMEVSQSNKRAAEEQAYRFHSLYQNTIATILSNPKMNGKTRSSSIAAAKATLSRQLKMASTILNVDIPWPT